MVKNVSSIHKSPQSSDGISYYEKNRKVTFHANVFNRTYYEKLTWDSQQKLFEPKSVSEKDLALASQYLCPKDYQDVLIERNASGLCGYPLCSKPPQEFRSDVYLLVRHQKLLDVTPLKPYCSKLCFGASRFYEVQLSTEPVYLRKMENWVPVEVVPLSVTVLEYMKTRKELAKTRLEEEKRIINKQYIHNKVQDLDSSNSKKLTKLISKLEITPTENNTSETNFDQVTKPDSHAMVEGYRVSNGFVTFADPNDDSMNILRKSAVTPAQDSASKPELGSSTELPKVGSQKPVSPSKTSKSSVESEDTSDEEEEFDILEPCKNPVEAAMRVLAGPSKGPTPKLNIFGKLFLFLDHCVTPCSKNYLKHLQASFLPDAKQKKFIVKTFPRDESVPIRRDMISKILLVKWNSILQEFQIQVSLKQELIDWIDTLDIYEPEMAWLSSAEALSLCLVLLKKFSLLFPSDILGCVTDAKIDEIGGRVGFDKDRVIFLTRFL